MRLICVLCSSVLAFVLFQEACNSIMRIMEMSMQRENETKRKKGTSVRLRFSTKKWCLALFCSFGFYLICLNFEQILEIDGFCWIGESVLFIN